MNNREYTCSSCGGTFEPEPDWSDEKAREEATETFADDNIEDMGVVCDDCYKAIMGRIEELQ